MCLKYKDDEMKPRILVADDSLTVQKVISITLANHSYDLVECFDEINLKEQLMLGKADLLLLDINLSEGKSGYDLVKEIKIKNNDLPVLFLLGTFDTIEEGLAREVGVSDYIVKPFESNTFIQKVQAILENQAEDNFEVKKETQSNDLPEAVKSAADEPKIYNDSWVVDAPEQLDKSSENWSSSSDTAPSSGDALAESLEGWGMSVPAPIGGEELSTVDDEMELPAIINSENVDILQKNDSEPSSHFVTTENFNFENNENETEIDNKIALFSNDKDEKKRETELVSSIEDEASDDEFWAVDADVNDEGEDELSLPAVQSLAATEDSELPSLVSELDLEEDLKDINFEPSFTVQEMEEEVAQVALESEKPDEFKNSGTSTINEDVLVDKILEKLKPMLKELVEKECKATIENVAWQIIPDLAENLIRNEIKEIRNS